MQRLRPHDRTGLIELVARSAPIPSIARAAVTGQVEVFGGFSEIPPGGSGFIIQVTTEHGQEFRVAVIPRTDTHTYQIVLVEHVPWENWVGDSVNTDGYSIYRGDRPEKYKELKDGSS